jgi:outer membrane protein OmpA-like peptidoglycan-associated protein
VFFSFNILGVFMKTQHLLFCLFGVMALIKVACADEKNVGKGKITAEEAIKALLKPKPSKELDANGNPIKSRAIGGMGSLGESALSMEIVFDYNSAKLTEAAKEQLSPVGLALASEQLKDQSFIVEGHTDAVGGQPYNKTLSEQRAASVKDFLVSNFSVPSDRIEIVGKGKEGLLDPKKPDSEVNRRVRFVAK